MIRFEYSYLTHKWGRYKEGGVPPDFNPPLFYRQEQ